MAIKISIVIPTWNEEAEIEATLAYLRRTGGHSTEIIVVDGSSDDKTASLAEKLADKVVIVKRASRGSQLHEGALAATGDVLLFLHADTRLPETWESILRDIWDSSKPPAGTAFRMEFNRNSPVYRFIAWGARVRSRITGIPHGDQGIAVSKDLYLRVGGFPPVPLMEEYFLGQKLLRYGTIQMLSDIIIASPRRYEQNGPVFNALRNAFLIALHYLGVPPSALARIYYWSRRGCNKLPFSETKRVNGQKMKKILLATVFLGATSPLFAFDLSHSLWTEALKKNTQNGLVDYKNLKNQSDIFNRYLQELENVSEKEYSAWKDADKIAFWINAYNAFTWKAIIDHYPIKSSFLKSTLYPKNSIRQIDGVWDKLTFPVMGKHLTLEHIEHQILRKDFNEPRIHMALVCAALGCPPLRGEAFTGKELDTQLDDQTRQFLSDPEKFRIDREARVVHLSPIFDWFGDDFIEGRTPKEKAVLNFIGGDVSPDDQIILKSTEYKVKYLKYDWTLNELRR